ncbi:hypothetical protein AADZ90_010290 [Aestuariibius sp. 2305UL40-4]|uniref:hypothetical protein n=1 Tax=Aestuariibius violaceus TaxID=3234132 RepID=UPI00345E9EE7
MRTALVLLALAAPVAADVNHNGKTIECYCTDTDGARVDIGGETCLRVDGRMFIGSCQMSLNVPIWRDTGRSCLTGAVDVQSSQG